MFEAHGLILVQFWIQPYGYTLTIDYTLKVKE